MAVYLSPGVYAREIDISLVATGFGATLPAFIGAANKGPMNTPVYLTNAQQYLDTFGEPFSESYLGYAVLAYFEDGQQCYVERVGVEYEEGMIEELESISIDTSGSKIHGWGRIPVFTGIDNGKIVLREPTADRPMEFHNAGVLAIAFNDIDPTLPTEATLDFTGAGLSDDYTGAVDDTFLVLITKGPDVTSGSAVDGAEYEIYRNSDGEKIAAGTLIESATLGTSEPIQVGSGLDATGLTCAVVVTSGKLEEQDSFTFGARPNNRQFSFWIDRAEVATTAGSVPDITSYSFNHGESFTDVDSFITRFNAIIGSGEEYSAVNIDGTPYVRTDDGGQSIQLMGSEAWAFEVGQTQYVWDIPRSYLVGNDTGPFNITTSNNRVTIEVAGDSDTTQIEFSVAQGLSQTSQQIAFSVHAGGVYQGQRYWRSYALQVTDDDYKVVIEATPNNQFDQLIMQASFSYVRTLRFAETLDIQYPYRRPYRGYTDDRVSLPRSSQISPSIPASCDPGSSYYDVARCTLDSDYYQGIVGYFVATTPGTWIDGYTLSLTLYTDVQDSDTKRFTLEIFDASNNVSVDRIDDISFDRNDSRYIANVVNPDTQFGGVNGNSFVNWEERPEYLANDPTDPTTFEIRIPSEFSFREFSGAANGIPTDPIYSAELDRSVIGNPSESSGVFAFENPEIYDINLLSTPGFSSGAVIGQCIQMAQSRGDVLYIVDPPYGLRPQEVVDWHNGMLTSDLGQAINSSYASLYWSWLKIFDQYEGDYLWVPPSGYQLGIFARTERVSESWFAPAGLIRGRFYTPIDVEYNPNLGERNLLYGTGNAVNPIVNFIKDGLTCWGQRTLQRQPTALDRVNVRMLLIFIKKNLSRALRYFVFEQNDRYTWARVRGVANGFLSDIAARRGLDDFRVVCDETNNTPERRDRNELWISCFLKPTRVAEFIVLNLVIMRSDMSFSAEEVLQAGGVVVGNQ